MNHLVQFCLACVAGGIVSAAAKTLFRAYLQYIPTATQAKFGFVFLLMWERPTYSRLSDVILEFESRPQDIFARLVGLFSTDRAEYSIVQ